MEQNYTLGRGKLHFARFKPGTRIPEGFRYIGNSPEFNMTIENETLDHFSSDGGIREKDDSVPLETTRTASLTTDNINPENVALFFFGTSSILTVAAATGLTETFEGVKAGLSYQLGITPTTPAGVRGIDPATFKAEVGGVALVLNTDYTLDPDTGRLVLVETSTKFTGDVDVDAEYDLVASKRERVISGSQPVEGALFYEANNPKGKNFDYMMPYVRVTPNGDYALKGDEWQTIPLNIEILKPTQGEAIYLDGRPFQG